MEGDASATAIRHTTHFIIKDKRLPRNFLSRFVKPSAAITWVGAHRILSAGIDWRIDKTSISVRFSVREGASATMQSYNDLQSVIRYNGIVVLVEFSGGAPQIISSQ